MRKTLSIALSILTFGTMVSAQTPETQFDPEKHATFTSDRADSLYVSSRAIAHHLMDRRTPRLQFRPDMDESAFRSWQTEMSRTADSLMYYPGADPTKCRKAEKKSVVQRDGYRVERWESYPFEDAVVPYLVLIPDGVDSTTPAPAIMCIPGFGQTKELLAGETSTDLTQSEIRESKNSMARLYAKEGYIAVSLDNPACGEPGDLEKYAGGGADYVTFSRALLELGWSYLGYTTYVDKVILEWMKQQPEMRSDRLIISGFSLGTEPLMTIGVSDPSIFAFVYNDFLCTTRERALVMTKPNAKGRREWPNDISHLIPRFLCEFDFPDLVAALAPRPVICTEGGMDRDFNLVSKAFEISGEPEAFTPLHYAKYAADSTRVYLDKMPSGIDRTTFFKLANVDPPHHYFKADHVLPWLKKVLAE